MNGPQHYAKAEELLASIDYSGTHAGVQAVAALAQVHATLALVAVTVEVNGLDVWTRASGASGPTAWGEAVSES